MLSTTLGRNGGAPLPGAGVPGALERRYTGWVRTVDGSEAFEKYITPIHRLCYNEIHVGDAAEILPKMATVSYDLLLLVDVLEHFEDEVGQRLIRESLRVGRSVLVSTPIEPAVQGEVFGNPYEVHRSRWTEQELRAFDPHFLVPNGASIICVLGENPDRVRPPPRKRRGWRRALDRALVGGGGAPAGASPA